MGLELVTSLFDIEGRIGLFGLLDVIIVLAPSVIWSGFGNLCLCLFGLCCSFYTIIYI